MEPCSYCSRDFKTVYHASDKCPKEPFVVVMPMTPLPLTPDQQQFINNLWGNYFVKPSHIMGIENLALFQGPRSDFFSCYTRPSLDALVHGFLPERMISSMAEVKCFFVEPVYGKPGSLNSRPEYLAKNWDPEDREVLMWINPATGEKKPYPHAFGSGAMWFAQGQSKNWCWDNETEPHLHIRLPDGAIWDIDSRCNNCTLPDDRTHRCWVRHGEVPNITVDKEGHTCKAGAGSVQTNGYHGKLIGGILRDC